jgi:hypothetical protein
MGVNCLQLNELEDVDRERISGGQQAPFWKDLIDHVNRYGDP